MSSHYKLILDSMQKFGNTEISFATLVENLDSLISLIENSEKGKQSEDLRSEWWTLEQVYAVALDQGKSSLSSEDDELINEALQNIKSILFLVVEEQEYDPIKGNQKTIYKLEWYQKNGGVFIGSCFVPTKVVSKLKYLFDLKEEETLDIYTLSELQVDYLQDYVEHEIDLNRYDYFIVGSSN